MNDMTRRARKIKNNYDMAMSLLMAQVGAELITESDTTELMFIQHAMKLVEDTVVLLGEQAEAIDELNQTIERLNKKIDEMNEE